jgi:hypothetical protein
MPRRGEHHAVRAAWPEAVTTAGTEPGGQPERDLRIGVRVVQSRIRDTVRSYRVDPQMFACSLLAAQLADEWVRYAGDCAGRCVTLRSRDPQFRRFHRTVVPCGGSGSGCGPAGRRRRRPGRGHPRLGDRAAPAARPAFPAALPERCRAVHADRAAGGAGPGSGGAAAGQGGGTADVRQGRHDAAGGVFQRRAADAAEDGTRGHHRPGSAPGTRRGAAGRRHRPPPARMGRAGEPAVGRPARHLDHAGAARRAAGESHRVAGRGPPDAGHQHRPPPWPLRADDGRRRAAVSLRARPAPVPGPAAIGDDRLHPRGTGRPDAG